MTVKTFILTMAVIPVSLHSIAVITQITKPNIDMYHEFFLYITQLYNKIDSHVNNVHNNSARPTIPDT